MILKKHPNNHTHVKNWLGNTVWKFRCFFGLDNAAGLSIHLSNMHMGEHSDF